jgi:CRP/FNR family cyclic AMP-dependent transcriptional regulator
MRSSPFDERYLDALTAKGTIRSYPKHTLLIQEGDLSDQIYVVLSGRLKVFLSDSDGKEIVIDALGPRQCFGEMALEGEPRSASVMATEPCKLAVIERGQFKEFLAANPEAAYALIVTVIDRARNLTRAIGSLAPLDVYGRVARLLLDNAAEENGTLVVGERLTQQEIAKRVGASRETVSRIVTDLREGGYIGVENDRMVIYRPLPKRW